MTASFLDRITPVLLSQDEEPNIGRALSRLRWAKDIVVVDSGSTDRTLEILRADPRVRLFARAFDTHGRQWRFAAMETGVATDWILRLDADYLVSEALVAELACLAPAPDVAAYEIAFDYAVRGHPLRASLYPPNTVLLRRGCFSVHDRGHTEAWRIHGRSEKLAARILHDDRKPTARFVQAQIRYMSREAERLEAEPHSLKSRLRGHPPLMPIAAFIYAYFVKGLFLDGRAGLDYALQRLVAESILALMALEKRLGPPAEPAPSADPAERDAAAREGER